MSHPHDYHSPPRPPWWAPRSGPDAAALRVSTAEREEVIATLIAHWSDGRLDEPTFDQRAARARAAVTRGDLDALLYDLPPRHPAPADRPPGPRRGRRGWRVAAIVVALIVLASSALPHVVHPQVPWLLVGLVALAVIGRRRHHHHHDHHG